MVIKKLRDIPVLIRQGVRLEEAGGGDKVGKYLAPRNPPEPAGHRAKLIWGLRWGIGRD